MSLIMVLDDTYTNVEREWLDMMVVLKVERLRSSGGSTEGSSA